MVGARLFGEMLSLPSLSAVLQRGWKTLRSRELPERRRLKPQDAYMIYSIGLRGDGLLLILSL